MEDKNQKPLRSKFDLSPELRRELDLFNLDLKLSRIAENLEKISNNQFKIYIALEGLLSLLEVAMEKIDAPNENKNKK